MQQEENKTEKEIIWEEKITEVNEIVDVLDKEVDEGIKETVLLF